MGVTEGLEIRRELEGEAVWGWRQGLQRRMAPASNDMIFNDMIFIVLYTLGMWEHCRCH